MNKSINLVNIVIDTALYNNTRMLAIYHRSGLVRDRPDKIRVESQKKHA
jgi:hypothetical protein